MSKALVSVRQSEPAQHEARDKRIKTLAGQLRENLLIRLHNAELAGVLAQEAIAILQGADKQLKFDLLRMFLERMLPMPVAESSPTQPTMAIQINNNLKRGRREFA